MATIELIVYGRPEQRGSKEAKVQYNAAGQPVTKQGRVLTFAVDSNKKSKAWMEMVTSAAGSKYSGPLLEGAIELTARFFFVRPQGHFGAGAKAGQLKPSAPKYHTQTPDLGKLLRSIEDALTGVVYRDDKQICMYGWGTAKYWTDRQARAEIRIRQMGVTEEATQ